MPAVFSDPLFVLCAGISAIVTGLLRGGFGSGIGGLAVPIMSLAIPPQQAAAIALPVLIASDVCGLYLYRMTLDFRSLRVLVPAGLIGTVIGWALFRMLDDAWIKLVLGLISVVFVLNSVLKRGAPRRQPGTAEGYLLGTISGVTSFVAHSGGPTAVIYLLGQKLSKEAFVSTSMVFFMILNLSKLYPYTDLGLFTHDNVVAALMLIPVMLVGLVLGRELNKRITPVWFFRLIVITLFLTGVKLTWDGATTILARI